MKHKTFASRLAITILLGAICQLSIYAEHIDSEKSIAIASKYIKVDSKKIIRTRAATNNAPYYIYNDKRGNGFVIVAADDAMGQVLAYSHTGILDTTRANVQLKHLLNAYKQTYNYIKSNAGATTMAASKNTTRKRINPLLKSKWDQSFPYNRKCGYYTGCVATAIAQIMYYHKWPLHGKGQHSYVQSNINKTWSADFSKSTYDWDNMRNTYANYDQGQQATYDAVALLMHDVGVAVDMQYGYRGSGAHSPIAAKGIKTYLDYSTSLLEKKMREMLSLQKL